MTSPVNSNTDLGHGLVELIKQNRVQTASEVERVVASNRRPQPACFATTRAGLEQLLTGTLPYTQPHPEVAFKGRERLINVLTGETQDELAAARARALGKAPKS